MQRIDVTSPHSNHPGSSSALPCCFRCRCLLLWARCLSQTSVLLPRPRRTCCMPGGSGTAMATQSSAPASRKPGYTDACCQLFMCVIAKRPRCGPSPHTSVLRGSSTVYAVSANAQLNLQWHVQMAKRSACPKSCCLLSLLLCCCCLLLRNLLIRQRNLLWGRCLDSQFKL